MGFWMILFVGFLSGWVVGVLTRGRGFGIIGNIVVGVIGSIVGGFVFGFTGIVAVTQIGHILQSVVGALFLLFVFNLLRPSSKKSRTSENEK